MMRKPGIAFLLVAGTLLGVVAIGLLGRTPGTEHPEVSRRAAVSGDAEGQGTPPSPLPAAAVPQPSGDAASRSENEAAAIEPGAGWLR